MALANDEPRGRAGGLQTTRAAAPRSVCAVVPTRNEAGNVHEVGRRLAQALRGVAAEVIFVDDSDDDTPAVVADLASAMPEPAVRLVHRAGTERVGGLGGAVLTGLRATAAEWVCVLDGDLQHPPELVPTLLRAATGAGADLVIATRYAPEGRADGLGTGRAAVSRSATTAARVLFPNRLRGVSDPMSGFFLARTAALELDALQPSGFKILLEILVTAPYLSTVEVSFAFAERTSGHSKAGWREGVRYARSLARLRMRTLPASTRPRPARALIAGGGPA